MLKDDLIITNNMQGVQFKKKKRNKYFFLLPGRSVLSGIFLGYILLICITFL